MDVKAFPALIVGVVVALVLAGAVLPVFAETTSATDTFKNVGYYDLTYSETDNTTLIWDHTKPNELSVNGVAVVMPTLTNGESRTVMCGDNWLIRMGYGVSLGGYYIQWYPAVGSSILASQNNGLDLTVICSDNVVSVTDTDTTPHTATGAYTYTYCVSNDGAFVMKKATDSAYMVGDSPIYAMGLTNVGTFTSTGIVITGNIDDGVTWSIFRGSAEDYTFSNQEINYTEVSNYEGLYKLDSMTATVTNGDQSADAVYSFFIVPSEVTAEKSVHPDGPLTVMLNVLPLLAIAGLVTGAVVWFINRKG